MAMPGVTYLTIWPEAKPIAGVKMVLQEFAIDINFCASLLLFGTAKMQSLKNAFLDLLPKKAIMEKM